MYSGDWLIRLTQLVRDAKGPAAWRIPANVWGLGVTSMLTDISSEMVVSVLPAYLVMTGGLAPLVLPVAEVRPLWRIHTFQLRHVNAVLLRKAERRLCGLPISAVRGRNRRPGQQLV